MPGRLPGKYKRAFFIVPCLLKYVCYNCMIPLQKTGRSINRKKISFTTIKLIAAICKISLSGNKFRFFVV